ncbi:MAG: hypothetical protein ABS40_08555 [Agrobacterium sp. SCN 61-19]|nr:MAG: hypothetical protein ABS40_08555 [Agrobacterium sp. SCN 61-19]
MNALPFFHKPRLFHRNLVQDAAKIGTADPHAVDQFRFSVSTQQVYLRLSGPGDMNMRRLVILRVDHETEAESAMNNNHPTL